MKKIFLMSGIIAIIICVGAAASTEKSTELTVYNQNFGVVKETRDINLDRGMNTVMIQDVAKLIDPTSVSIKDLTATTQVLEQNYLYDLVRKEKIYEKYIGKEITVIDSNGYSIQGILLSFSGTELVIQNSDGVHILKTEQVSLPKLPEGLITKPTLKWLLDTDQQGTHQIQLSYMTGGLNWVADYVAVVNEDDSQVDLTCWVTITNNSGASYKNARLKLIAGDVHRVREDQFVEYERMEEAKAAPSQFQEEAFFEYHMYTLQRPTDIVDNQQKQVTLFEASDVSVKKEYVFDSGTMYYYSEYGGNNKIKVMLALENTEENNMGIPLPRGKVRVYKKDSDGQLQFIGEDMIDHTPKDEKIRVYVGDAFDLVGEKKQTEFDRIGPYTIEVSYEVSLRNHKDEDVTIASIQRIWGDWKILESSHEWEKEDAWTAVWYVDVPKDGEVTITYTIRIVY